MNIDSADLRRALTMFAQYKLKYGLVEHACVIGQFERLFDEWSGQGSFSDYVVREVAKWLREDGML